VSSSAREVEVGGVGKGNKRGMGKGDRSSGERTSGSSRSNNTTGNAGSKSAKGGKGGKGFG